jgi:hypothetical protein
MLKTRNVEEEGSVESEAGPDPGAGGRGVAGLKALMIQTVVHHANPGFAEADVPLDVDGGVPADGDDGVLAPGQLADHDAAVEHAERIVFAGDPEGGEVVDGGGEGAGSRPEQSAVGGDVDEIPAVLPDETRQDLLVPENVPDCGPV